MTLAARTIGQWFGERVDRFADRTALIDALEEVSYATLGRRVAAIAKGLACLGVGSGTRVGILLPNRSDWLAVALAALDLGAWVVPLNTLYRASELNYALHHADVTVLIMVERFLNNDYAAMLTDLAPTLAGDGPSPRLHPRLPNLRSVVRLGPGSPTFAWSLDDLIARGKRLPERWLDAQRARGDGGAPAILFYTSGTTAAPKAVVHTHASILHAAENVAACLGLTPEDRTWGYLPFFFTGGLVSVALATLCCGGAVLLQEVFDPGAALELMERHKCTTFFAWPHQAEALAQHPGFDRTRLALRKGVGGNTPWAARLYPADHVAVGTWGMTESGPMAAASSWSDPLAQRIASHGRPRPGVELRVVDPRSRTDVAAGETGEILIRGATLMDRYLKTPRRDCFDPQGWFHTGDLGHVDGDGNLTFVGRLKDIIKTAGVNVAAAEVEAVLAACPGVKLAHVFGIAHPTRGEDVAAAIVRSALDVTSESVLSWCRQKLASYKVPRRVVFVVEGELPLLGSGKIDKRALRSRLSEAIRGEE